MIFHKLLVALFLISVVSIILYNVLGDIILLFFYSSFIYSKQHI